ncbi:MAG: PadR family transcriptional regulator [Oscillibacter sp.]|uniref:PadR family transcriptional regulator n=1 Tax=Oscillibacter sp. TaxID=1945593 RepID=UPI00289D4EF1|nr:PadR family transcriptional regulator [Oscillibacter sp.]MEA4992876.1 PadR family transcriptional regulator [Oscillibacter sp.]
MISSQMLKGTLEGCILKVIRQKETYGYEISESLRAYGFADISEGTIYPLLLRLEKNELITAQYRESPVGPKRKYFSLTPAGEEELDRFYSSWRELEHAVNSLFQKGGK